MSDISRITYTPPAFTSSALTKAPAAKAVETALPVIAENIPSDAVDLNAGKNDSASLVYKVKPRENSSGSRIGKGYDENFLGEGFKVSLPEITGPAKDKVLKFNDKGDTVRNYTHFSLVMNKDRKMCFYAANNIDGAKLRNDIRRGKWQIDETIGEANQVGHSVYGGNQLDKGHMVRRLDVAWGDKNEAQAASDDTFNYTNATPQHADLNQKSWLNLEDWLLVKADEEDRKVSVFTGPIFKDDDKPYRGIQLPAEFWKIVTLKRNTDGQLAAAAFMMSQKDMIEPLYKNASRSKDLNLEGVPTEQIAVYQVPLSTVESLTGLDFGELKDVDAYSLYKAKQGDAFSIFKSADSGKVDPRAPIMTEDLGASEMREIKSSADIII